MSTTMRALLDFGGAQLRLIVPPPGGDAALGDVRVSWVHGSDLSDPSPFLERDQLLLTDGAQFAVGEEREEVFEEYVARLAALGLAGIGFGSRMSHGSVPAGLAAACERHGLVLLELTDMTPFLAFIRFVADAAANERQERASWTVDAQRAIARAALRPDGLSSVLAELERLLGARAALFDASGVQIAGSAGVAEGSDEEAAIRDAVLALLERGVHSAVPVRAGTALYTAQTLADEAGLAGTLVLSEPETPHIDAPEVISSVTALASLALAQHRTLDEARRHLRAGVLEQLLSGDDALAARTAEAVWGRLPDDAPVVVAARPRGAGVPLLDALERVAADASGGVFFALRGPLLVLIAEQPWLDETIALLAKHGTTAGSSRPDSIGSLTDRLAEAQSALEHATSYGHAHVTFGRVLEYGMLGALMGDRAEAVARGILAPVLRYDAERGTELLHTLRVWLDHDCAWNESAAQLRVHRHTLRHRIDTAGRLLQLDLARLRDRLELWAAIRIAPETERPAT